VAASRLEVDSAVELALDPMRSTKELDTEMREAVELIAGVTGDELD
jgi:hypothetical protein